MVQALLAPNLIGQEMKTYELQKIPVNKLFINGNGDNPIWNQAHVLSDFSYPWNEGSPPPLTFQGLHDRDYIYGLYRVHDSKKIHVYRSKDDKKEILSSDRVEIFFRKNEKMETYHGLELDALGRIYDYKAHYHRDFHPEWSWPSGHLIVKARITDDGYTLEFAVSKKSLKKLGMLHGSQFDAGLYRGEVVRLEGDQAEFKWISWVKPDSETPNFHIPSSFGKMILK